MFTPLRIRSGYSFLKSGLTISKIVRSVNKFNYYAAAITDINVFYGAIEFFKEISKINKKAILGVELTFLEFNLYAYPINEKGYLSLIPLLKELSKEQPLSFYDYCSIFADCIGIISTDEKFLKENINNVSTSFNSLLNNISKCFSNFYIGLSYLDKDVKKIREYADKFSYNIIAFPLILYEKEKDAITLEIVKAIEKDEHLTIKEKSGNQCFYEEIVFNEFYLKNEMDETINLTDSIAFEFIKKRGEMVILDDSKEVNLLKDKCFNRLKELSLDNDTYINRLNYELDMIISLGYGNYFLIVEDYINYAKSHDILVGPGRGSAVGSLVSYLLNITTIDPIKYDLGFERFLNPNRKTMPDIDTDFEDTKREEIVEYLRNKYGKERVANIISFQTILAKQALRDIGRVYGYKTQHIDLLAKTLSDKNLSLSESYKKIKEFRQLVDSDKYFLEIVSLAYKIEFLPRQNGMHASGYILNKDPLDNCLPIICDFNGNYISQYEFIYLEEQGFLKMDLLGIRNLSIISSTCDLINKNGKIIDKFNVPYDEKCVYDLLNSLSTMGIFQLESSGIRNVIKNVKPTCFNDISALIALYRPGPMPNIDLYAKRKNNNIKIEYISKDVEKILSPTYGIIVYQEQISQLAELMAGFSKIDADSFRQAISKKKGDVLHSLKESFIEGSISKGYSKEDALKIFDSIDKFEAYGFNKPHSVAYAKFACQMAYLKAKYPKEFYISLLDNVSINNDTKFIDYLFEMKKSGININLPSINKSEKSFIIEGNNLLFPLNGIKGINNTIIDKIIEEREKGLFLDFYDFITRMYKYKISENQILQLINSGSFDEFTPSRETLRKSIQIGLRYAKLITVNDTTINLDLGFAKPLLNETKDLEMDNLEKEYEALGVNLSKNPLSLHEKLLEKYNRTKIIDINKYGSNYIVVGIIRSIKRITTKKGNDMAFIKIFDETGEIEIIAFNEVYSKSIRILSKNKIVLIKLNYSLRNNEKSYIANEITLLEELNNE